MTLTSEQEKLDSILSNYTSSIAYKVLPHEINYRKAPLPKSIFSKTLELPQDKHSDPIQWSEKCVGEYIDDNPCIVIPGREFDIFGTRHGYGYGWYDRFLSHVPKEWLRIGIIETSKLYSEKITRQPWDEPVDWILVCNLSTSSWKVYETFAREN